MIYVVEVVLRLDMLPIHDLFRRFRIDAALSGDLAEIHVDAESYSLAEERPGYIENRLRFSVAHELGHYVLHGEEIRAARFPSIRHYKEWAGDAENAGSAEYQAHEFAGRLLVPRDSLLRWFDHYASQAKEQDPLWWQVPGSRDRLAELIAPRFQVNRQVIETRFDRESLWPAE